MIREISRNYQYTSNTDAITMPMRAIRKCNAIMREYCGYRRPQEIADLWGKLCEVGLEVGAIIRERDMPQIGSWQGRAMSLLWNGKNIENTMLVYTVYEGNSGLLNDYNIYLA